MATSATKHQGFSTRNFPRAYRHLRPRGAHAFCDTESCCQPDRAVMSQPQHTMATTVTSEQAEVHRNHADSCRRPERLVL